MTGNDILILQFYSSVLSQIWSYYSGFIFFGVSLTSIMSALLCISIILPLLFAFTSSAVNSASSGSYSSLSKSKKEHEIALRRKK